MTGMRAYAAAAVLAVFAGAGVAYCQHHGDDPAAPVDCAGVAFAVPAGTKTKTKDPGKPADSAPREVRKEPRAKASSSAAAVRPSTSPSSSSSPRRHNHIDLDLDLDGC